ncbi:MAG TPA: ROK family protein [Candidatus Paceibacterota bacterium]|nr:ROK family protein [Verrucomicrobiota bacterium]HOX02329.1 ROK family protein [Verrucomicrobiota bacterium]HRZ45121.1 ROK family protein [Candidatus Paceibacterota bacterium]HRZ93235.1 ROK family protein [Candidatus Paceibacterota bacterium]
MKSSLVGIEIGGTKLQVVMGDASLRIGRRWRFPVDAARGREQICEQLEPCLHEIRSAGTVAGAGIGFGGPVDWSTGVVARSHQVEGWSGFPLGEWIAHEGGWPVRVDNDANVAALGESRSGAGQGRSPVLYVTLGSGVGGGLTVGGRIYHGAKPGEMEIGHVRLDRKGATVESRCSGWAVDARARAARQAHPESALARQTAGAQGGEARLLPAALAAGDAAAREIWAQLVDDLAFGLSHAVHLAHPELVVLGGGLALIGEPLRLGVAERLQGYIMDVFRPGPRVELARLGEDAVPAGALALAAEAAGQA